MKHADSVVRLADGKVVGKESADAAVQAALTSATGRAPATAPH